MIFLLNQEAKKILEGEVDELFVGFDPEYGSPLISLHRHTLSDGTEFYENVQDRVVKGSCLIIFLCLNDKEGNVINNTVWSDDKRKDIIINEILRCPLTK